MSVQTATSAVTSTNAPMTIATQAIAQILRAMYSPSTLVHVGWGNGMGELTQWTQWQVPHAFVIEAEEDKLAGSQSMAHAQAQAWGQASDQTGDPPPLAWQTLHATLAAQMGDQPYHQASNPSESGLLPTEALRTVWPRLHTLQVQHTHTTTLDTLWPQLAPTVDAPAQQTQQANRWLIIDCLPSADILAGSVQTLAHCQVVCARSLAQDRASLSQHMQTLGWIEVAWTESNHPAIGHIWYTRNPAQVQAQLEAQMQGQEQLQNQLSQPNSELAEVQKQLETVKAQAARERLDLIEQLAQQEKDSQALKSQMQGEAQVLKQALQELNAQLKANENAKKELQAQLDTKSKAADELQSKLDAQAKAAAALQAQLDAETSAKQAEVKAKADLQKQVEAQLQRHTQSQEQLQNKLNHASSELAEVQKQLDTVKVQAAHERQDLIAQLAQQEQDSQALKSQMQEEVQAQQQALQELNAQLKANENAKSELQAQLQAKAKAQTELQAQLDTKSKVVFDLQVKLDTQNKAALVDLEAEKKKGADLQKQLDNVMARLAKQQIEYQNVLAATANFPEIKLQAEEREQALAQLQSRLAESDARQRLMNEELLRANAQIDLIKDLCLRESGL